MVKEYALIHPDVPLTDDDGLKRSTAHLILRYRSFDKKSEVYVIELSIVK